MKIAYIRPDIRFHLPGQYVQFNDACPNCDAEGFISCGNAVRVREEDHAIFPITRKSLRMSQTLLNGEYLDNYLVVNTLEDVNEEAYYDADFLHRLKKVRY